MDTCRLFSYNSCEPTWRCHQNPFVRALGIINLLSFASHKSRLNRSLHVLGPMIARDCLLFTDRARLQVSFEARSACPCLSFIRIVSSFSRLFKVELETRSDLKTSASVTERVFVRVMGFNLHVIIVFCSCSRSRHERTVGNDCWPAANFFHNLLFVAGH